MTALFLLLLSVMPGPKLDLLEYLIFPEGEGFTIITKDSVYHSTAKTLLQEGIILLKRSID